MALLASAIAAAGLAGVAAMAQGQNEQFIPALVYCTGPYAPNGIPFADGYADYLALMNERDGGINGVKIITEECETGYATDRGVECYERLKNKGPTGAAAFSPLSTGITYALIERAPADKIPVVSMGYGRADSADGAVFTWVFPILGTYWTQADALVHYVAGQEGGYDKLKGKKIAFIYHDSPYGKEPIPVFHRRIALRIRLPVIKMLARLDSHRFYPLGVKRTARTPCWIDLPPASKTWKIPEAAMPPCTISTPC
jgi:branched-chain amino acid transport system substrate-binding protein